MTVLPLFEWLDQSAVAHAIRTSAWLFPVIESVHLAGLALLGGAILLVDLRLSGFLLGNHSVRALAADAQPWVITGLAVMLPTGGLLLSSEALRCYENPAFWVKMTFLALAMVFTFTVRRRVTSTAAHDHSTRWHRPVAIVSLLLWSGVGWAGRWIGFS